MHALVIGTIFLARSAIMAPAGGLPSGGEAPSATDLLRAKRMADEAAGRLQVRPPKRSGWVRGGAGWEHSTAAPKGRLPARRRVR
jgi:hypothetical protein